MNRKGKDRYANRGRSFFPRYWLNDRFFYYTLPNRQFAWRFSLLNYDRNSGIIKRYRHKIVEGRDQDAAMGIDDEAVDRPGGSG